MYASDARSTPAHRGVREHRGEAGAHEVKVARELLDRDGTRDGGEGPQALQEGVGVRLDEAAEEGLLDDGGRRG